MLRMIMLPLLAGGPLVSLAQASWAKIPGGDELRLLADRDRVVVPVRVALDRGVNAADLRVRLRDVRFGNIADQRFMEAFSVDSMLSAEGNIRIGVDLTTVAARQGAYELLLELTNRRNPSLPPLEFPLTVAHPEGGLQSIPTRVVDRVKPIFGPPRLEGMTLFLKENGGFSRLTDLVIHPQAFTDGSKVPVDVSLEFENGPLSLDPNGSVSAPFRLEGRFPLGKTAGTAEINAPQLRSPVLVNFEINNRLSTQWIWPLILFGIALGWLTRNYLKRRVELSNARLAGVEVRDRLLESLELYPDEVFRGRVEALLSDLKKSLEKTGAEEIRKAAQEAEAAFVRELEALQGRKKTGSERVSGLLSLTGSEFWVPGPVQALLAAADSEGRAALADLEAYRVKTAEERLDKVSAALGKDLRNPLADWKNTVERELQEKHHNLLPEPVLAYINAAVPGLKNTLAELKPVGPAPAMGELQGQLQKADLARRQLRSFIQGVRYEIEDECDATVAWLRQASGLPDPGAVDALERIVGEHAGQLDPENPERALQLLNERTEWLLPMSQAWRRAILNQEDSAEVKGLLDQGKFTEAARKAVENLEKEKERGGFQGAERGLSLEDVPEILSRQRRAWAPSETLRAVSRFIFHSDAAPAGRQSARLERSSLLRENRLASLMLTLIASVLITLVGYLLFLKDFTGTPEQMTGIVLWAYGLDITIEKVVEEARKIKT